VVFADRELLAERASSLGLAIDLAEYDPAAPARPHTPHSLEIVHVPLARASRAGTLDPANARAVLDALRLGVQGCMRGEFCGLVTGPVHKGVINDAGLPFTGHTELLAELSGARLPVMLLCGGGLRVALATTHLPLARVSAALTRERLADVLEVLHRDLQCRFGLATPRILVCGLNPSVYSADAGIGFARPGNRFWAAALAAGIVTVDRDTRAALTGRGVGMTDLVKRATPRADELTRDEYRDGLARVERLVQWLQPGAVCFVGLAGWRAAVDRKAVAGVQPDGIGGRPAYVMPSTSGLNAHSRLDDLADHLRAAAALADRA